MFNNQQKQDQPGAPMNNAIGRESFLEGTLETSGNLRIDGKIIGDVKSKAKIVQGSSSSIQGNITASSADIGGKIKGKVEVTGELVLGPESMILGDIVTNRLVVESGAKFNGKCTIGGRIKSFSVEKEKTMEKASNEPEKMTKVRPLENKYISDTKV